jgi:GNAT superfamily N-acetyltransferase
MGLLISKGLRNLESSIRDITKANLIDIPTCCKGCVYWEFPDEFDKTEQGKAEPQTRIELEQKKREWFLRTMNEFGTCGKVVYCDDKPVAYAQFAPSERLPNTGHYKSHFVSKLEEGVVFLSCLYVVDKESRRKGIGEALLRNIIDDLRRRGFKSVETFARRANSNNPSGPLEFYTRNGFVIKDQTNLEFPLVTFFLS